MKLRDNRYSNSHAWATRGVADRCTRRPAMWRLRLTHAVMAILLAVVMIGCGARHDGRQVVALSFDSQRYLLEAIAGDDFDAVVLLPAGSDPETFEPDMRAMRGLEEAQVYLTTSTLGFETSIKQRVRSNYPDLKVIDISDGIDVLTHTHEVAGEAHEHPEGDPHLLASLRNARIVSRNILASVVALNPDSSEKYCRRYDALDRRLAQADARVDSMLHAGNAAGGSFVVMHPSLSYYARDYGLTQIPLETDGKEATPRQLEQRLQDARTADVRALFYERGKSEAQAREIAASLGVEAWPIYLNGDDFMTQIMDISEHMNYDARTKNQPSRHDK